MRGSFETCELWGLVFLIHALASDVQGSWRILYTGDQDAKKNRVIPAQLQEFNSTWFCPHVFPAEKALT